MNWFFEQWLYEIGNPIFEITKSYDETQKNYCLLSNKPKFVNFDYQSSKENSTHHTALNCMMNKNCSFLHTTLSVFA
jgi:aminopeptidase N